MYTETFPYPPSGTQPQNTSELNPPNGGPATIAGGVNSIYLPIVGRTPNTSIYLSRVPKTSGPFYIKDNIAN